MLVRNFSETSWKKLIHWMTEGKAGTKQKGVEGAMLWLSCVSLGMTFASVCLDVLALWFSEP